MRQTNQNRQLILDYYAATSGVKKTEKLMRRFTTDDRLIAHVLQFDNMFPSYQVIPDEITTEEDRIIVQGRRRGKLRRIQGEGLPKEKTIEIPFAMGYRIRDHKIVDHWFLTDQMELLEQLDWIETGSVQ